jgi:hypothetical protein
VNSKGGGNHCKLLILEQFFLEGSLDNGYLVDLNKRFSNKFEKKIFKIEKNYGYVLILID